MSHAAQVAWVLVWLVLVTLLVAALVVLALSKWGRSQPIRICAVLSLLSHVLLAGYAATIQIVGDVVPGSGFGPMSVSIVDDRGSPTGDPTAKHSASGETISNSQEPWNQFAADEPAPAVVAQLPRAAAPPDLLAKAEPSEPPPLLAESVDKTPAAPPAVAPPVKMSEPKLARMPLAEIAPAAQPNPIDVQPAKSQAPPTAGPASSGPSRVAVDQKDPEGPPAGDDLPLLDRMTNAPAASNAATGPVTPNITGTEVAIASAIPSPRIAGNAADAHSTSTTNGTGLRAAATGGPANLPAVPEPYRLRVDANRSTQAARNGGSPEAEAAVQGGLRWLVMGQSEDGRWDCAKHGGGGESQVGGNDRHGAGATADSAMTGLALLALLGSGNTHQEGPYQENVRRGLQYLLRIQKADGSLSGDARLFEAMYCHGMATFALSEAFAMTGDKRLQPAVSRAVAFILASQHPTTGGWRYQPGDPGDTSQLGWQVMALRSAELGGIQVPPRCREGISRFLGTVASGERGGLASYRPGERVSRTMTAEALACREFMSLAEPARSREAADYVVEQLPGEGEANLYYWYYATLSLYQMQDDHWHRWNEAMQRTLIGSQRHDGDFAGSWDADTVWGNYGGRVYSTALSTLCLEVYYRYLPIYNANAHGAAHTPTR
ncbi:MAG: squalene--hopene cyclase [Planctomycetia bacterium]|nr:squalene--hopene cyclase [Planctomycetia bacterium]